MKKPVDFEGKDLEVGDEILYIPWKGGGLRRGTVAGFTPQKIRCLEVGLDAARTYTDWKGKTRTQINSVPRESHDIAKI